VSIFWILLCIYMGTKYAFLCPGTTWRPYDGIYRKWESISLQQANFMFMGPCFVNVFEYNQQDAMLHNNIYYYNCSTCFRQFLRPSSGAQNCIHGIRYLLSFFCFLPLTNSLTIAVRSRKTSTNTWCRVYSFELLMMGGGTAWNM